MYESLAITAISGDSVYGNTLSPRLYIPTVKCLARILESASLINIYDPLMYSRTRVCIRRRFSRAVEVLFFSFFTLEKLAFTRGLTRAFRRGRKRLVLLSVLADPETRD